VSSGFHFEDGRPLLHGSSVIVCNHCDEILMADIETVA
jgi:hypothetical protein